MKKLLIWLLMLLAIIFALAYIKGLPMLKIASGYSAKCMCTNIFVSNRSPEDIEITDLAFLPVLPHNKIDLIEKSVTSSVFGLGTQKAILKEDLGCMLLQGKDDYNITYDDPVDGSIDPRPFPLGDEIIDTKMSTVDYDQIEKIIQHSFDEDGAYTDQKTRSLLILYKDTLIAEHYGQGHNQDTRIIGWSMTKSIMNTIIGMLVLDGKMDIQTDNLWDEWKNDDRKNIKIIDLLRMNSGLNWEEDYSKFSDATEMLYMSEDIVKKAISVPSKYTPGTHWYYSSGTSNILSGLIRKEFRSTEEYLDFPHQRIFNKIGMDDTIMETDESGNYIGSSYCYATTRDWARYGSLYLHDGVWDGERLLPEKWIDMTTKSAEGSNGQYGAQFWLNKESKYYPNSPSDLYSANGFQGQKVIIIPSKELVIVRTGFNSDFDFDRLISDVCKALE